MKARDIILAKNIFANIVAPLTKKAVKAIQNKKSKENDKGT